MRAFPWSVVGFVIGAGAGFMFGKKSSTNFDKSISTNVSGGRATVTFDAKKFVRSGLPDFLNRF